MDNSKQKCIKCKEDKDLKNFIGLKNKPVLSCKNCRKNNYIKKGFKCIKTIINIKKNQIINKKIKDKK